MKNFLNNIITFGLSCILIDAVLHIEYHIDKHEGGYNICKIGCEEKKHHSINHQCQKCLNKNQKLYFLEQNSDFFTLNVNAYYTITGIIYAEPIIFDLHIRPPPSLT